MQFDSCICMITVYNKIQNKKKTKLQEGEKNENLYSFALPLESSPFLFINIFVFYSFIP